MGYRAPSAEEVYRYVFRLDRYSRSLTDGFSLSIIFVNDASPVCQDLISNYFVDLCHRTADRIRIIFFSELPEAYFEDIVRRMHSNSYSAERLHENGLLNQVIEEIPRFYRSDRPHIREEILNDLFEALPWRNYNEIDFLLSRISRMFGPRYADALYRLVRQHQNSLDRNRNIEAEIYQLIVEMKGRIRRDPFRRMYDDHWRDLTPNFMVPIDAPERTRALSFEAKNNIAMPGVGESMRFAARLGIGRYIPCFVFFTDIGELTIDVFPIGDLSAHEAYSQMRYWIDNFYQENQVSLNKWNQIEQDIISFINSINQPLTDIKNWIDKSERLWDELRSVAQIIVRLRELEQQTADYKSLIGNLSTSSFKGNLILSNCRARLKNLSAKREKHRIEQESLEAAINRLKTTSISTRIYDEFFLEISQSLTPQMAIILQERATLITQYKSKLNSTPEHQLFQWWENVHRAIPSYNKFKKAHKKQPGLPSQSNESIKSKYIGFIASIFDLSFSDTQEIFLEKVKQLCDEWDLNFPKYSLQLTEFSTQLHAGIPKWIDATDIKISVLLPFHSRDHISLNTVMADLGDEHPIHRMIRDEITSQQEEKQEKLVLEFESLVFQYREQVLTELDKLRKEPLDTSAEEIEVYTACLRDMYDLRNTIEKELVDLANSGSNLAKSQRLVESKDIKPFLKLLKEYKNAISEFVYPYKKDRRVQQVNLNQPFPQIFELELRRDQLNTSKNRARELEQKLEETIPNSNHGVELLQNVQQVSETVTPKARLASEVLKIKQDGNPLERLEETLHELNDQELRIISNSIAKLDSVVKTRDEVINIILAIVGLLPARELATHRQYANRPINLEITTMTEHSKNVEVEMNFHAPVTGATGKNDGTININITEQKQTLAEAANEIQRLLKQLEETYPSATESEQVAYVNVEVQPSLKQRTIAALKAAGETSIDEFFLENKYLKVGKAVIKAWIQPSS